MAEIGDIHRFPSPSKLASWAGLVPSPRSASRAQEIKRIREE
ncbi:MAG: transposase [Candidatus Bathyarchaeia archaeon]